MKSENDELGVFIQKQTRMLALAHAKATDEIIIKALSLAGLNPEDESKIKEECRFEIDDHGVKTLYHLDTPLLTLLPLEIDYSGEKVSVHQKYQFNKKRK